MSHSTTKSNSRAWRCRGCGSGAVAVKSRRHVLPPGRARSRAARSPGKIMDGAPCCLYCRSAMKLYRTHQRPTWRCHGCDVEAVATRTRERKGRPAINLERPCCVLCRRLTGSTGSGGISWACRSCGWTTQKVRTGRRCGDPAAPWCVECRKAMTHGHTYKGATRYCCNGCGRSYLEAHARTNRLAVEYDNAQAQALRLKQSAEENERRAREQTSGQVVTPL